MRHRVAGKKLSRSTGHRQALFRNLTTELLRHGKIRTTEAKAEAIRPSAEKLITIAKKGLKDESYALHARRLVAARLNDPQVVKKVFEEIAPRYLERPGGYTRVLKLGRRQGDGAEMVLLELVE
ncbi:MAG: 50S ribosomal protein L17 [Anaerolineae bacterium]|jgi:large subunit ribosomal protein L17|nr:50S ribosomal protein L17 [Anaerolineae bacterium]